MTTSFRQPRNDDRDGARVRVFGIRRTLRPPARWHGRCDLIRSARDSA